MAQTLGKTGLAIILLKYQRGYLAEEVGFEPTKDCSLPVFKTGAFNRSAIPPKTVGDVRPIGRPPCADGELYHALSKRAPYILAMARKLPQIPDLMRENLGNLFPN